MYANDSSAGVQESLDARAIGGITGVQIIVHARGTTCSRLGSGANYHWRTLQLAASASTVTAGVQFVLYARGNLLRIRLEVEVFLLADT